jgi:hypothetical protein
MRKSQDDYLNKLRKELDTGNNFVDYFITYGLSEDVIFSDFLYQTDLKELNSHQNIKPVLLSKFPPFEKSIIQVDENIINVSIFCI